MDVHKIEVKTYLAAEEFVAFSALCERKGLAKSGVLRSWVKQAIDQECARIARTSVEPRPADDGPEVGNVEVLWKRERDRRNK